jgi:hypothetical protein
LKITYLHELIVPVGLVSVESDRVLLIGGIGQIRAEEPQVLLLFVTVLLTKLVEIRIDGAHFLVNEDGVLVLKVVADAVRHLCQQLL